MYFRYCFVFKTNISLINKRFHSKWILPEGYDTSIKVYNCIVREKVPFIVRNKHSVTWYTCGPTVYDSSHIGHASCYVKLDIIQRILRKHFDLNIVSVMNITDIDDKIISRSNSSGVSITDITKRYEKEFFQDLKWLNVLKPNVIIRVTDNIDVIKNFIKKLVTENKAYGTSDGSVYFQLDKYKNYGKLTQNISTLDKENVDFALWKGVKENEPSWEAEWGSGRPGWHIECSAMASTVFGSSIDVHAGGIDLQFPHHENEETQSCSYFGKPQWVNYWFHTGHLHLSGQEKMSKSLKNTVTIEELSRIANSDVFRMSCLISHYRTGMEFSSEVMKTAENYLKKVKSFVNVCESYVNGFLPSASINELELIDLLSKSNVDVIEALKDDFNTAKAFKIILDLISVTNKMIGTPDVTNHYLNNSGVVIAVSNFVREQMSVFGVDINDETNVDKSSESIDDVMNVLNEFRQNVRNYALENKDKSLLRFCDSVRKELKERKIDLQDFGKVSSWHKS